MNAPPFLLCLVLMFTLSVEDALARVRFNPLPQYISVGDRPLLLRARAPGGVRFTSSNSRIARITGNRVRAIRAGNVRITARARSGNSRPVSRRLAVGSRGRFMGSTLATAPNWSFGVETAPRFNPVTGAPELVPSGQTSATFRNAGYLFTLQPGSVVPGSGIIRNVRVRCGANPALMQVVIMSGSPGFYGTALRTSRTFRPRPNAVTTVRVDLPVTRSSQRVGGLLTNTSDAVGLNVFGPGSLPIFNQGTSGTYAAGSSLLQHWFPIMRRGVPENERGYEVDGLELLMSWEYIQTGSGVLR